MCLFLCNRVFKDWSYFISKCRKEMCWFKSFKFIKGLLPVSSFSLDIYCLEIDLSASKIVLLLQEILDFCTIRLLHTLALKILFTLVLVLFRPADEKNLVFSWPFGKYSDLLSVFPSFPEKALTSMPVEQLESLDCRTILLPMYALITTF